MASTDYELKLSYDGKTLEGIDYELKLSDDGKMLEGIVGIRIPGGGPVDIIIPAGAPASLRFWNGHPVVGDFVPAVRERWAAFLAARTPGEALEHRDDFHVLCEGPDGDFGAAAFNAYLQELLPAKAPRLCKVNVDDELLGISHWDIAVQMPDDRDRLWLPGLDGGDPRSFATALLPSLEPAWALTVKEAAEHSFKSCFAMLRQDQDGNIDEETLYAAKDCCRDSFQLWKRND